MRYFWAILDAMLVLIGLAGMPDDIATWNSWLKSIQPYINNDVSRWAFLIIGMALLATFHPHVASFFRMYPSSGWLLSWSISKPIKQWELFPYRRLILLKDAALIAYRKTSNSMMARLAARPWGNDTDPIGCYAAALLRQGSYRIYGIRLHLKNWEEIPLNENHVLLDDSTSIRELYHPGAIYNNVSILRKDLKTRIDNLPLSKTWIVRQ